MKKLVILCMITVLVLVPLAAALGCQQQPAPAPTPAPTPAPAAPTPTPSPPPPEPSPPPEPTVISEVVLYSDDFSDETRGWDTFDDEDGSAFYHDEALHLKNNTFAEYDTVSFYSRQEFTDFVLEVETKLVDGTDDNSHHVLCRVQPTIESNNYRFVISADGYYGLGKEVNGELIEMISMTRSIHIRKGKDTVNLMRVECIGSTLRLSANGHLLVEEVDSTFTSGFLGLGATAWTEQHGKTFTEITFDNLVVTTP